MTTFPFEASHDPNIVDLESALGYDLQVSVSQANGRGIQTTESILTSILFRSGLYASIDRTFPSNIKDVHESYLNFSSIRGNSAGFLGRKRESEITLALYGTPLDILIAETREGGALILDSSIPLPDGLRQETLSRNLTLYELDLSSIQKRDDHRRNSTTLGFLLGLLGVSDERIEAALQKNFPGKDDVIKQNLAWTSEGKALYAQSPQRSDLSIPVRAPLDGFMLQSGNQRAAAGAVAAGARAGFYYPITPASSYMEGFEKALKKLVSAGRLSESDYLVWLAESEIASSQMAIGAALSGARVVTSTALPGFNNYMENLALAAQFEVPGILWVNVQRMGISTGSPTRTADADLLTMISAGGPFPRVIVSPGDVEAQFSLPSRLFNIADAGQLPVILLTNLWTGENLFTAPEYDASELAPIDRGPRVTPEDALAGPLDYARYLMGRSAPFAVPGTPGAGHIVRGGNFVVADSADDPRGRGSYSELPGDVKRLTEHKHAKLALIADMLPKPQLITPAGKSDYQGVSGGDIGLIVWGSAVHPATEAQAKLAEHADVLQLRTVYPLRQHAEQIRSFVRQHARVAVVEQNFEGQLRETILKECYSTPGTVVPDLGLINRYDGRQMTAEDILEAL